MLIATHVVSDVECIAKEILFLRSGKIVGEKETPEKLVEQMEELVWEVIIRPDQLSQLEQVLLVSNVNIAKGSSGARNRRTRADEGTTASVWMGNAKRWLSQHWKMYIYIEWKQIIKAL